MNQSILDPSVCLKTVEINDLKSLLHHIERNGGRTMRSFGIFDGLIDFFRENPQHCKDVPTTLEWVEHAMNSAHWENALQVLQAKESVTTEHQP